MKEFGVKTADELKIEAELQTILDPCAMCQKQMDRFREMYKAKITVYSSGAKDEFNLGRMYPKLKINNLKLSNMNVQYLIKIQNTPKIGNFENNGIPESEIEQLEIKTGVRFPQAYKEFLYLGGDTTELEQRM